MVVITWPTCLSNIGRVFNILDGTWLAINIASGTVHERVGNGPISIIIPTNSSWWSLTGFWVTASLLDFPGLFSVFLIVL